MGKTTPEKPLPHSKKRKRQDSKPTSIGSTNTSHSQSTSVKTKSTTTIPISKKKKNSQPLKGLILAVSTLDVKGQKHAVSDSSYQAVSSMCQELGAKVTGQVHKKVFAVICNQSAVNNLTQRVRKAIKKKHSFLIDVEWIRKCKSEQRKVDYEKYNLTDRAETAMEKRDAKSVKSSLTDATTTSICEIIYDEKEDELISKSDIGWSKAVSLDCCCVCHETNRDDCKWCIDCNVTLARKAKLNK